MRKVRRIIVLCVPLVGVLLRQGSTAEPLWSAGMEDGNLHEWAIGRCGGEYNSGVADTKASHDQAYSGTWAARLTVSTPNSPTSGTRLFRWCEPQEHLQLYYRA
ncbi:MAG: hypothetical protein AB7G75_25740 [Candidatus Binatia bacterium]